MDRRHPKSDSSWMDLYFWISQGSPRFPPAFFLPIFFSSRRFFLLRSAFIGCGESCSAPGPRREERVSDYISITLNGAARNVFLTSIIDLYVFFLPVSFSFLGLCLLGGWCRSDSISVANRRKKNSVKPKRRFILLFISSICLVEVWLVGSIMPFFTESYPVFKWVP